MAKNVKPVVIPPTAVRKVGRAQTTKDILARLEAERKKRDKSVNKK